MNKQTLLKTQPIVYQILSNALKKDVVSNAYLFCGPRGTDKFDAAILFAKSLLSDDVDEDGFTLKNHQDIDDCVDRKSNNKNGHCKQNEDLNFILLDEKKVMVDDIDQLQSLFEHTRDGRMVYILNHYDNATIAASNSMLKFLEEPSDNIHGILIADEKANVLPTIQSRCQIIQFKPTSCKERLLESIDDEETAEMLGNNYSYEQACALLKLDDFEIIRKYAHDYLDAFDSMSYVVELQRNVFCREKNLNTDAIALFIRWLIYYLKQDQKLELDKIVKIYPLLVEGLDMLRRPVDLSLFMDKLYHDIRKAVRQ